jgi:hypothetical protein
MNIKEIEELLDKYYEGETTLEEEKVLKTFFTSGDVPMELSIHKSQFVYFAEASGEKISEWKIDEEVFAEKVEIPVVSFHSSRNRFYYISGIAATVLLLIGLIFTFNEDVIKIPKGNVSSTNPELVFTQTRDILALVSVNLNKGMDKVQYLGKLDEAMQKMQMLSKYYQYQTIIINPDQFEKRSEKIK